MCGVIDAPSFPDAIVVGDFVDEYDLRERRVAFALIGVLGVGLECAVGIVGVSQGLDLHAVAVVVAKDADVGIVVG